MNIKIWLFDKTVTQNMHAPCGTNRTILSRSEAKKGSHVGLKRVTDETKTDRIYDLQ